MTASIQRYVFEDQREISHPPESRWQWIKDSAISGVKGALIGGVTLVFMLQYLKNPSVPHVNYLSKMPNRVLQVINTFTNSIFELKNMAKHLYDDKSNYRVATAFYAGLIEELVFRYAIQRKFFPLISKGISKISNPIGKFLNHKITRIALTALLFTLCHTARLQNGKIIPVEFIMGSILGVVAEANGLGLPAAIMMHFGYDLSAHAMQVYALNQIQQGLQFLEKYGYLSAMQKQA